LATFTHGGAREHPYNPTPTLQFLCAAKIKWLIHTFLRA
jgi:hypothetical protein